MLNNIADCIKLFLDLIAMRIDIDSVNLISQNWALL